MHRLAIFVAFLFAGLSRTHAQWDIEASHTIADLRGIDNVGKGIAWASGANGTVLRTTDNGVHWQACAVPRGAENLDFRGIRAFDASIAIVMSSGKGPLSRLYKTTDACRSWTLLFTNPDSEGFWDTVSGRPDKRPYTGTILGDPVGNVFQLLYVRERGEGQAASISTAILAGPRARSSPVPPPLPSESSFAASNSSLVPLRLGGVAFATGGAIPHPRVIASACILSGDFIDCTPKVSEVPMASGPTAGIFSLATRELSTHCPSPEELAEPRSPNPLVPGPRCQTTTVIIAVGGDFGNPAGSSGTAAYTQEEENASHYEPSDQWQAAQTLPHGYRSAVAYDAATKTWITVGPNGTDISTDDGRNWRALKPSTSDPQDADQHWNALSLPFVVGPHGRIGRLDPKALAP